MERGLKTSVKWLQKSVLFFPRRPIKIKLESWINWFQNDHHGQGAGKGCPLRGVSLNLKSSPGIIKNNTYSTRLLNFHKISDARGRRAAEAVMLTSSVKQGVSQSAPMQENSYVPVKVTTQSIAAFKKQTLTWEMERPKGNDLRRGYSN